ncbi:MAG: hypothetical protein WCY19_01920 [Candidatus Gastranaerophilaceae bacterium]
MKKGCVVPTGNPDMSYRFGSYNLKQGGKINTYASLFSYGIPKDTPFKDILDLSNKIVFKKGKHTIGEAIKLGDGAFGCYLWPSETKKVKKLIEKLTSEDLGKALKEIFMKMGIKNLSKIK